MTNGNGFLTSFGNPAAVAKGDRTLAGGGGSFAWSVGSAVGWTLVAKGDGVVARFDEAIVDGDSMWRNQAVTGPAIEQVAWAEIATDRYCKKVLSKTNPSNLPNCAVYDAESGKKPLVNDPDVAPAVGPNAVAVP